MAKRSQRRALRHEKDKSGCMWGFISMFDFRHGRSTRRLLSDRKRGNKNAVGASRNKFEMVPDLGKDCECNIDGEDSNAADAGKSSVKKLIEEDMFNEQDVKEKRTKKTRKKSSELYPHDLSAEENLGCQCSCNQNVNQQSINSPSVEKIMEEFHRQIVQKSAVCGALNHYGKEDVQSDQWSSGFEEKLSKALQDFAGGKFDYGKDVTEDQRNKHSRALMDALQISSSDEELYLKLLQNPKSLLVNYFHNLQHALKEKTAQSESLDGSLAKQREDLDHSKQHNIFRRKMKPQGPDLPHGNEKLEASNRIVILKPGPNGLGKSHTSLPISPESNKFAAKEVPPERVGSSPFSLARLRKKFKHASGDNQHEVSPDGTSSRMADGLQNLKDSEKAVVRENSGRYHPKKEHFYIERASRHPTGTKRGSLRGSEASTEHEIDNHPNKGISNLYNEAKKHLSEILSSGDEGVDFLTGQIPKTLGGVLSIPDYNFSPIASPRKDFEHGFVPATVRFSAGGKFWNVNDNTRSSSQENSHFCCNYMQAQSKTLSITDDMHHLGERDIIICSSEDEMSLQGDVEATREVEIVDHDDGSLSDSRSILSGTSHGKEDKNDDISNFCEDERHLNCSNQDSVEENQPVSPTPASPLSSSVIANGVQDKEDATSMPERPSPVSVLEPLFSEDDINPGSSICQPVVQPMQSLEIHIDEGRSSDGDLVASAKTCLEDKELICDYVKTALKSSGLNWTEFWLKWLSSEPLLDPSLFNDVDLFSNQPCCDRKLLHDCINEVLMDVCECTSPWLSFVKHSASLSLDLNNQIHKVCEGVWWHLAPLPLPRTLDQIVRKDMDRTRTWMDLHFARETIATETAEAILTDLVENTVLSCVEESSNGLFHVFQDQPELAEGCKLIICS